MNLWHKTAAETETHPLGQPWYVQPETIPETQTAETTQTPPVLSPPPTAVTPTHFEPEAAERILARAGLLQETHRQNLSKAQVEAIAAEIGIEAEFVRLAMEQEAAGVLPRQETRVSTETVHDVTAVRSGLLAAAMAMYAVLGTYLLTSMRNFPSPNSTGFLVFLAVIPTLLALTSGLVSRRRRQGLAWGAGFGAMAVTAGLLSWQFSGGPVHLSPSEYPMFAVMIAIGALLGLIGAETRRQVSWRRVRNRGRRTERRT